MKKAIIKIDTFNIIGIAVETTNENGQSAQDMGVLWGRFFSEQVSQQIPNKINEDIYVIYTDYETDYKGKHTAIIGHIVADITNLPVGLIGRTFVNGIYQNFTAKGAMPTAVQETWQHIWANDEHLNRAYIADFEVYGIKAQNGANSEVEIYVGIKIE